ncbi:MAG: acyl-homoserine-lactone synthase [Terricaulis sp.]
MRVHVVTANNRSLYLDEIEAMHRHRYQVFVAERGWKALESDDGLDIDEFDNEHATYLIAIANDGAVAGSARLIPSWRPNMLKTLFPEYCKGEVPVGPGIWEWSRHATPGRQYPASFNVRTQLVLNLAVIEFGISRGMEEVYGVLEAQLMPWTAQLGWESKLLGPPVAYGEGMAVASISPIKLSHLRRLRAEAKLKDPVLIELPGFSGERGRIARRWLETVASLPESELATFAAYMMAPQIVGAQR